MALLAIVMNILVSLLLGVVSFIGFMLTDLSAPVWRMIDNTRLWQGANAAIHSGTPWGFTHEELNKLDLSGKVAVITGANTGLGYGTAYLLASRGASVVLGCRSENKCKSTVENLKSDLIENDVHLKEGQVIDCFGLDLASFESVRKFGDYVAKTYPLIDSLILNAGVAMPPFGLTKEGLEMTIGVNHFGHFLLTDILLPCLLNAAKVTKVATIVAVSSSGHFDSYPVGILPKIEDMSDEAIYEKSKFAAYGQSKLANILMIQELSEKYETQGILANSIHPGFVSTELARNLEDRIGRYIGKTAAMWLNRNFISKYFGWTPKDAALTTVYCAFGPKLVTQGITGKYFNPIARESEPSALTKDKALQKRLWTMTEDFINKH